MPPESPRHGGIVAESHNDREATLNETVHGASSGKADRLATAIIVFLQVRQEARLTRYSVGMDALLRFEDKWNGMARVQLHGTRADRGTLRQHLAHSL